jgi:hypothetical protein
VERGRQWIMLPKRRRCVIGHDCFSLWSLKSLNLTIGILISNNWFLIVPLD